MGRGARIKLEEIGRLGAGAQAQIRAQLERKPELAPAGEILPRNDAPENGASRLRQARAPKLNKTETAFGDFLRVSLPAAQIHPHGITLLIANGCRYTPDFFVEPESGDVRAYEVKGPHAWDDAIVKLKVAAAQYRRIAFWLVSRDKVRGWRQERVFPLERV